MIMKELLRAIRSLSDHTKFREAVMNDYRLEPLPVQRSFRLPLLASLIDDINRPLVVVSDRADHASRLFDEFGVWAPESARLFFPEPTPNFYEDATWELNTRQERLEALTLMAAYNIPFAKKPEKPPVIFTTAKALMTRTIPRRDFIRNCKQIKIGGRLNLDDLFKELFRVGYLPTDIVLEPGQVSKRGGILDVWVPGESAPIRVEFFDIEVESIRAFDHVSQRTIKKLDSVLITPAREYIFNEIEGVMPQDVKEFHIPLLHPSIECFIDHLPKRTLFFQIDPSLIEGTAAEIEEQALRFRDEQINDGLITPDFPEPYVSWGELLDSTQNLTNYEFSHETHDSGHYLFEEVLGHDARFAGKLKQFLDHLALLSSDASRIVVASRQADRLQELFEEQFGIATAKKVDFQKLELNEGFTLQVGEGLIHLLTDSEIFGWDKSQPRRAHKISRQASPEAIYGDLKIGDYVVHVDYGIGRFTGLAKRTLDEHEREYIVIEYKAGDTLYVPIFQADRITRYISPDGSSPSVTRLGTPEWSTTKSSVKEAVQKVAEELLALYARRQTAKGFAFKPDTHWQKELEDSFPFVETPDQIKSLTQIKQDMETARPMDRLLCGDVGYGKTEIALRAAFKAVQDGKQVAVLVPTTVLALQHYDTFRQRLAAFPVRVEMLSRFKTPQEQDGIIKQLEAGSVDIVIGTHRLVSKDVQFKDLGLAIIDEEQRFGVTHKEHLKNLRVEVDVLTLTATPIPRTLYMALSGVRDISNLNTPPEERLPVITHIGPYSSKIVRQAILREMDRGGQVFFVHNRVTTIYSMKMHLEKLVPEARVGVGHGQMHERDLEKVMHAFADGKIDILLSTTIIESGLDIPNANTLIIDRADTFGLAQLYQLRGRVGRAANRAYAYFFRHKKRLPTAEGQERLDVLAENTQLGAGYSIAMRDLEIRGAGELLGNRQSGHIISVGFHLYTRMLATEVKKLRHALASLENPTETELSIFAATNESMFTDEIKEPVTVELPLAIGIPTNYIPKQEMRLRIYRRIASLRDIQELESLTSEFQDRFGPMPEMCENLFFQMRVKLMADHAGITSVSVENQQVVLRLPNLGERFANRQLSDLTPTIRGGKNAYWCNIMRGANWQPELIRVLEFMLKRTITIDV